MNTTKNIVDAIQDATQSKRSAYDTSATVKRIEGDTAWVHIPGGVDETPVSLTISASIGDTVQIRVGGGKAWIVGNATSPPTDDTKAKSVAKSVDELRKHNVAISGDVKRLYKGVDGINTLIRESSDGVEVGKVDSAGSYTAGHTLINASDNSYDVIDANGDTVASFGSTAQIGALDDSHITLSNTGIKMFDSSGDTVASFGSTAQIGALDDSHITLSNTGIKMFDSSGDTVASFGSTSQIGASSDSHIMLSDTGIEMVDSSGDTVASFGDEVILGKSDGMRVEVSSRTVDFVNGSNTLVGQIGLDLTNTKSVINFNKVYANGCNIGALINYKTYSLDNQTISAGEAVTLTKDVTGSISFNLMYTPIGVIGFDLDNATSSGKNVSYCNVIAVTISNGDVNWQIYNTGSAAAKIKAKATVLYVANGYTPDE